MAYGFAVFSALFFCVSNATAQMPREQRTITGNYYDTTTIAPTNQRIKSLKLPAGFSIAKFAEISKTRILHARQVWR